MPDESGRADRPTQDSDSADTLRFRLVEAILFASAAPLSDAEIAARLPESADLDNLLRELQAAYAGRGVNLVRVAGGWAFRTAEDLAGLLSRETVERRKLSRAAVETLAVVAYHQPVTRADIEAIRGVSLSKGTLDVLIEAGWVRLKGRRRTPGRPVVFGTTPGFLDHFGLASIGDLPGLAELKAAGLLDRSAANASPEAGLPASHGWELVEEDNAATLDADLAGAE